MKQADLAKKIYSRLGLSMVDSRTVAACLVDCLIEALNDPQDGEIAFDRFGKLFIERAAPRLARNTFKNEPLIVPEQNRVKWKASKTLLDSVNEGGKIYNIATKPPPTRAEQREAMNDKRNKRKEMK